MTTRAKRNWSSIYEASKLKSWGLPAFEIMDTEMGTFNKLYLKCSELPKTTEDGESIDFYTICADVFVMDQSLKVDRSTYIFARRIEVANGAKIHLDRMDEPVALLLASQEVVNIADHPTNISIDVTSKSKNYKSTYSAKENMPLSIIEWEDDPDPSHYNIKEIDEAYFLEGEPLRIHLRCIFQLATLLSNDFGELSIRQYKWVASLAAATNDTRTMCGEALALASITAKQISNTGVILVPDLDYSLYAESAGAFLNLLDIRQKKQLILEQSISNNKNWLAAAKDLLHQSKLDEELNKQLLEKAKSTRDDVLDARATIARQIAMQRLILYRCERKFRAGVENWKIDETIKGIFGIIMGSFKMLSALPSLLITGPVSGVSAVMSVVSGATGLAAKGVGKVIGTSGRAPLAPSAGAGASRFGEDNKFLNTIRDKNIAQLFLGELNNIDPQAPNINRGPQFQAIIDDLNATILGPDAEIDQLLNEINDIQISGNDPINNEVDFDNASQGDIARIQTEQEKIAAKQKAAEEIFKKGVAQTKKAANAEFDKGVKELAQGAGELMDAAMAIKAAEAKAKQLNDASENALKASNKALNLSFSSLELSGLDVVTGGAQAWDNLALEVDKLFERTPQLEQIAGGSTYRKEMNKLLLMGKTYATTRLAVAKANAELAEMIMRERSASQSVEIYEARVNKIGDEAANDTTIVQLAYGKILDAKRSVFLAMESYRRALLFHTLADDDQVAKLPKFYSSIDEFQQAGANIVGKKTASELFKKGPTTMPLHYQIISKEDLPQSLFEDGSLNIPIPTTHPWFNIYYRIRLYTVRIYALGLESNNKVVVNISTNGNYEDKTKKGKTKIFSARPLKGTFVYDGEDHSNISSEITIAPRFENDFFKPTPFTTWTVRITQQNGEALDFSKISGLKIEFSGEKSDL